MSEIQKNPSDKKSFYLLGFSIKLILIAVLTFSLWQIFLYFNEGKKETDFNNALIESAVSEVSPEDVYDYSETVLEQITPFEGYDAEESKVLFYPDIKVDFEKIKKQYPHIVGWIYSPGTPINYPVVQGTDNAYYVERMPNGAVNSAGSIFMDYRDSKELMDFVHVLYGHNMKNNSMFGTVLDYKKDGYFKEHPFMFYFTENGTYRLEIFAGVNTVATSSIYDEPDDDKREAFIASAISKSTFASTVKVTKDDRIFMISTCSGAVGQQNRYVLFAKLVQI